MGLDMYLNVREVVKSGKEDVDSYNKWWKEYDSQRPIADPEIGVSTDVGYWRKANAIHGWFVRNCQNGVDECQLTYVPREKLQELYDLCYKVIQNPSLAKDLLPVEQGFFFGGYDYNKYYHEYIEETAKIVYEALHNPDWTDEDMYFTYQSSW